MSHHMRSHINFATSFFHFPACVSECTWGIFKVPEKQFFPRYPVSSTFFFFSHNIDDHHKVVSIHLAMEFERIQKTEEKHFLLEMLSPLWIDISFLQFFLLESKSRTMRASILTDLYRNSLPQNELSRFVLSCAASGLGVIAGLS